MKFISFKHNQQDKFGIIINNKITDLTGKVSNSNSLNILPASSSFHLELGSIVHFMKKYKIDNPIYSLDIDTEYDWLIANAIIEEKL